MPGDSVGYSLGIDLGTTRTAAAVHRDGVTAVVTLDVRSATIPSAVHVAADGTVLVGESALRRGATDPSRLAREFKRRIGDPEPLLLGGIPWAASALTARLLSAVIDMVTAQQGGPADRIALAHPANWGPYKTELLLEAAQLAGLSDVTLVSEPEAAAIDHGAQTRVPVGSTVAVYDLGGGTFDAAVLRTTATGFVLCGRPGGLERFGGIDVDAAVLGHVRRTLGDVLSDLDPSDPLMLAAMTRLRDECAAAKEALSVDVEVAIPVVLPSMVTEVRLTRRELEDLVEPALVDTVTTMSQVLHTAGVQPADLHALLLVGGASRMPLVSRLLIERLGIPLAVDAHPKHVVASGAALAVAPQAVVSAFAPPVPESSDTVLAGRPVATGAAEGKAVMSPGSLSGSTDGGSSIGAPMTPRVADRGPSRTLGRSSQRSKLIGPSVVVLLCVVGVAAWWLLRSDDDESAARAVAAAVQPSGVAPTSIGPPSVEASPVDQVSSSVVLPLAPASSTVSIAPSSGAVVFDSVERDEVGGLRIRWSIAGGSDDGVVRVHLFYDTQHPESAGVDAVDYGRNPGIYYVVEDPSIVASIPSNIGTDDDEATAICGLAADAADRMIDPAAVMCVALPS